MSTDVTPVASSPTTESVTPAPSSVPEGLSESSRALSKGDFAAFRQSRRAERAADAGVTLPTVAESAPAPQEPTEPAEPAPQATADQPDQAPAAEKPKHKGADARIQELLRQRYEEREARLRLEGELNALRQQMGGQPTPETKPAASSPARVDRNAPDNDPEPKLEDFEADPAKYPDPYTAYVRAVGKWEARQEFQAQRQAEQQRIHQEQMAQAITAAVSRLQSEVDADFRDSLRPEVAGLAPSFMKESANQPPALTAIADEVMRSEHPRAFLSYLNDHPDEMAQMARMHPVQLFKALGRIEASITAKPAAPVAPVTTSAPPPPTTLGTRPADPGNPVEAAVNRGDFSAYRDAKRRAAIASAGLTR